MNTLEWKDRPGGAFPSEAGRIFCLGGNYKEHQREMRQDHPAPNVFVKVDGSYLAGDAPILIQPEFGELHYEGEFVMALGQVAQGRRPAWRDVAGLTVGVDLTRRDVQAECRKKGTPWEKAKSFVGSARLAPVVPAAAIPDPSELRLNTRLNGELRQTAKLSEMIFSPDEILATLHEWMPLRFGDLVFTGTPAGIGPLSHGDVLEVEIEGLVRRSWNVIRSR